MHRSLILRRGLASIPGAVSSQGGVGGPAPLSPINRLAAARPHPTTSPAPSPSAVELYVRTAGASAPARTNWTREEIQRIYDSPLIDLLYYSATVHRAHHDPRAVQQCTLLSIKTGGCSEDCSYW